MSVRVRFAPSPSGYLHVGGARTALFNYLFARRHGGVLILRIEDTDEARSTEASIAAIFDSMRWLGLQWDEGPEAGGTEGPYFQSQRREIYRHAVEELLASGHAYHCYCTPEELEARRAASLEAGGSPGYDGRCRGLSELERQGRLDEGRAPAVRFHVGEAGEVAWEDGVKGLITFQAEVIDDFVVMRADGLPTYNFAAVVDDHAMSITHVIRGDDHVSNTPRQLLLYRAFGWDSPVMAHVPMILGEDGARLSKRHGATSVGAYQDEGYLSSAFVNFLALLGWSLDGETEIFSLAELERVFDLDRVGGNPSVFNLEKLRWMNGQYMNQLSDDERVALAEQWLAEHGHDLRERGGEWRRAFILALGERFKTFSEIPDVGAFALREEPELEPDAWQKLLEKPEVGLRLRALADRIRATPKFDLESLEAGTRGVAADLGIKAGELMGAARVALTGRTTAPGLFDVMWLVGREQTLRRIESAAERWSRESPHAHV